ncbi:uncharacterized protein LOC124163066 [Ischnura elegans]|uniref:uncharacterized protein LOC124163066 n=1 Tax=Ischnura elegans TaxID=197161 RepID=UPI001ED8865B|nr:uncharacterized protein LOC124163066 [Ischnura elegans]
MSDLVLVITALRAMTDSDIETSAVMQILTQRRPGGLFTSADSVYVTLNFELDVGMTIDWRMTMKRAIMSSRGMEQLLLTALEGEYRGWMVIVAACECVFAPEFFAESTSEQPVVSYVSLLAAKTKIAPLKLVSVPHLELCAAVLLTRFLVKIVEGLQFVSVPVFCWTDSAVSLAWIRGHHSRWKTFVAHRVAEIQTSLPGTQWSYVNTKLNPADAATRGISPDELMDSFLWWSGPSWLAGREEGWSCGKPESSGAEDSEMRMAVNHSATSIHNSGDVLQRFSSYLRLLNVMSLCLRWLHNFRDKSQKRSGFVSPEERAQALTAVIRSMQSTAFRDELAALSSGKSLKRSSPLLPLRPFCDADGLLRVGGRLRNAVLDYDEKHPIIIPKDHHFTVLLVRHAHAVTLHGGLQATAAYLSQRYWIIRSRVVVKREIRTCVTCARFRGATLVQRMGDLPEERVKPQRPFLSTGLDYAGPFLLRATKGRDLFREEVLVIFSTATTPQPSEELCKN